MAGRSQQFLKRSIATLLVTSGIYLAISKLIFDEVYLTSKIVIDEEFHLPLGKEYCKFDWTKWDDKVTTLPGLYIASSLLLGPLKLCSTYYLRFFNLLLSTLNIFLFYLLLQKYNGKKPWTNILIAINLALFPPLYFFSFVYYTDILSVTIVLATLLFYECGNHFCASIFGLFSIIVRQNNIIWVGMMFAKLVLHEVYINFNLINKYAIPEKGFLQFLKLLIFYGIRTIKKASLSFWLNCSMYLTVLLSFVLFVILNGGVVVGDKTAHETTFHIPQLFYFAFFSMMFTWPRMFSCIKDFYHFVRLHICLVMFLIILSCVIVMFNTQIHPYLLADNRHIFFYIWNRSFGKYSWFKYVICPSYVFAFYCLYKAIWSKEDISFPVTFIPCAVVILVTQKLVESRYFILPFVLLRLRMINNSVIVILLELITYLFVNYLMFKTFFTKEVYWNNFEEIQRIIW